MADLSVFAEMASRAGVVPRVPQRGNGLRNRAGQHKTERNQLFIRPVPHVPLVPPENDTEGDEDDVQVAFDERAAILEYDEGLSRAEAERMARIQIFGAVDRRG